MKPSKLILTSLCGLYLSTPAQAADRPVFYPFQEAVQRAVDDGFLDGSVTFYLAGTGSTGTVLQADVVTNKKTNAFAKKDEVACDHVLRSALIQLQTAAKNAGATSVRNIVSYYKKDTYSSTSNYQCSVGTAMAGVALKGDLVK
ncbi:excinuclease ATPase subunit [Vitreoscilla massiliensis]|uniref:Excinuclease ATPase subunit n=1 Tax=Vitreoscilla massiliensis TaxID=1689272 RepID=A0ABY4E2P1_9NEIS|nr:hypothetical protein [Vitreoscilla massiliensis]UOO90038.1 excinuclease ATPase subunit [Vitreoscilla massiliensis]